MVHDGEAILTSIRSKIMVATTRSARNANKMASTPLCPFDKTHAGRCKKLSLHGLRRYVLRAIEKNPRKFMGIFLWERRPGKRLTRTADRVRRMLNVQAQRERPEKPSSQTRAHRNAKKKNPSGIYKKRMDPRCLFD